MSHAHCTVTVSHSLVKVEENKRKAIFKNPKKNDYKVTIVDGCVIKTGVRSDYLVSEVGAASVIVELKGVDVGHGCEQLFATAKHSDIKPMLEGRVGFLMVCTRVPRFDTYIAKAKTRAAREFRAGFQVVSDRGEFDIRQVASIDGKGF